MLLCFVAIAACSSATAQLMELKIVNCTDPSSLGFRISGGAIVSKGGQCVTAIEPVGNGGIPILDKCTGASTQQWLLNSSFFPTIPNASTAIVLPKRANSPAVYGLTFPSGATGPNSNARLAIFDIGARFHGECTGHHNCDFNLDSKTGQISTYWGKFCVGAVEPPAKPTPAPTPPTPDYNGTIGFSDACGSHMVLQQQPAKAAVYGPVGTTSGGGQPAVEVTVSTAGGSSYTVQASIAHDPSASPFSPSVNYGLSWKALLHPAPAGGNITITASCKSGCSGSATISDVTFGDVFFW